MPNNEEESTSLYYRSDFYDADKTLETHDDDNLCWSAASSNQLWAAYWGRLNGISDEEDLLFDVYQPNFPNVGGHNYPSLQWFLEGKGYLTLRADIVESEDESEENGVVFSRAPGGFYKDVLRYKNDWATRNIRRLSLMGNHRRLYECVAHIRAGYTVNVNIRGFDQNTGDSVWGGHAITLWGMRYSNKYPGNDVRHIKSIVVSDSDDYQNRPTPYHNCPYVERNGGRGCFEISVQWQSDRIAAGRRRGAWVLGSEYAGGGAGYSFDIVLMDSVILSPKPEPYPVPSYESSPIEE